MIDLDKFLDDIHGELKSYTDIPQLILGVKDIPIDQMIYPRGKMSFTTKYTPQARQSIIKTSKTIPSNEPEFEKDIEFTYILSPEATLSINFYGESVSEYVDKARQWFLIDKLGARYIRNICDCAIKSLSTTQNRKTFLETEYEDRQGFDVILGFSEKIKIAEKTIEKVDFTVNGDEFSLDL